MEPTEEKDTQDGIANKMTQKVSTVPVENETTSHANKPKLAISSSTTTLTGLFDGSIDAKSPSNTSKFNNGNNIISNELEAKNADGGNYDDENKSDSGTSSRISSDGNVNDNESLFSDQTHFTGVVSSLGDLYRLDDPLIVIIGVGKYDGMPNLDGVPKDYENIIKTFSMYWKYNVLYKLDNNEFIYTNEIDELNDNINYKSEW